MPQIPPNNYIASTSLEEYFVDKVNGLPLANGYVHFYKDQDRATRKLVYKLTGDPDEVGGYAFAALPNPVRLSSTGTFVDQNGSNIAVYYYPYDTDGNLELYYVEVEDENEAPQFTRSAWPPIAVEIDTNAVDISYDNQISNSQFVDILFSRNATASQPFVLSSAGTHHINIAPDWILTATTSGATSVTVTRNAIAGGPPFATNPPFTLTITPGPNINVQGLYLRQRLPNNPGIWSQINGNNTSGYVSGSLVLAANSAATMTYVPSTGATTAILAANNATPNTARFQNTAQLPISTNPSSPFDGYVDIFIYVSNVNPTTLTSVQVVGLPSNQESVPYIQETVNRQLDHLYHYYQSKIFYKPIPSYLVGWDFPLNPSNITGAVTGTLTNPANSSQYVWDQTIVFTEVAGSNITYSRAADGSLRLQVSGPNPSKVALIQYLDKYKVNQILSRNASVHIAAKSSLVGGLNGNVSLYYSKGTALPNVASGTNQSIVASLNANGSVATLNQPTGGDWILKSRNLVNNVRGAFTVTSVAPGIYTNIGISGWGLDESGIETGDATLFAIVVGFAEIPAGGTVTINSISLVPGDIPTIPAPQTQDEVLRECQAYFWRTYAPNVLRGTADAPGAIMYMAASTSNYSSGVTVTFTSGIAINFPSIMRSAPVLLFYSLNAGNVDRISIYENSLNAIASYVFVKDENINLWSTNTGVGYVSKQQAFLNTSGASPAISSSNVLRQAMMVFHLVADARLGIV